MTPFSGAGISDLSNILARHANACIGVRGFFIIDTPIPSWIGLRDKKASGFIPVCALVPFIIAPLYGHVNGRWIKATVLDGIMQSTTSLLRYMMAWCMLRYERYQALAA